MPHPGNETWRGTTFPSQGQALRAAWVKLRAIAMGTKPNIVVIGSSSWVCVRLSAGGEPVSHRVRP